MSNYIKLYQIILNFIKFLSNYIKLYQVLDILWKTLSSFGQIILTLEPSGEKYVTRRLVVLVGADTHLAKRSRESSHLKIGEREDEPSDYNYS